MNFDKQLDVFSRNLSEIRRNGRYSYQAFSEKLAKVHGSGHLQSGD
ncbi:MAG: hypothetical protein ACLRWQ_12920 [Flavonifractor plautii]